MRANFQPVSNPRLRDAIRKPEIGVKTRNVLVENSQMSSFRNWIGNFRSARGFWKIPEAPPLFKEGL
jgi:hypothetical protein